MMEAGEVVKHPEEEQSHFWKSEVGVSGCSGEGKGETKKKKKKRA